MQVREIDQNSEWQTNRTEALYSADHIGHNIQWAGETNFMVGVFQCSFEFLARQGETLDKLSIFVCIDMCTAIANLK